jgi:hypothetical protein
MNTNVSTKGRLRRNALCIAMGLCMASMWSTQVLAANTDGTIVGHAVAGTQVTVRNPQTGFVRSVTADADGSYRLPFLPVGEYVLQASKDGAPVGQPVNVTVTLGNATTVDLAAAGASGTLEAIEVTGSRVVNAVDVTSTESATNITAADLERLPVERDPLAVALLAPGLVKGEFGGVSFGGSSVAENSVYINGLNVTDFYNRVGFSSVPFSFYKEFQVKTGGYSVEFGRTTGGVINAVTKSGTNDFHYGAEVVWEPSAWQENGTNHYDADGNPIYITSHDEYDRTSLNVFASGALIRDKLFFFAMYEARDFQPTNTSNTGNLINEGDSNNGFWGTKLDWQINDRNLLEFLAFSDTDDTATDIYAFDLPTETRGDFQNTQFLKSGGKNWSATYTSYLTDTLSAKVLYGENERNFSQTSLNDINCNRIRDRRDVGAGDIGCTSSSTVAERLDNREAARIDFEWQLGDHLLRFGLDHETNTSNHTQYYPGPNRLVYEIFDTEPGATLENGGVVPGGVDAYVRSRTNEVDGTFETINSAYYIEDNWSITPTFILNAGLRVESFDNKNSDGDSYIKIENMLAPRFGFSWDMKGDGRMKVFGNVGRYFLPVANVINIKQAGGFRDERTFYVFNGLEDFEYNGVTYQRPILGPQIGPVDNSQGDGTVGDLRGEVDADMDPVYQDELILGFQQAINDAWSYGVRGIYRKLHNAIDDLELTSNGILCDGEPGYIGYIMGNPGKEATVYTDTDCDGVSDAYVTIDTSQRGWALYDDDGNYVGETGWVKPRRDYKALEFVLDRAWDEKWAFNASYTLAWNKGNAEGPVNSDTDFADAGRTENFDDPWVNYGGFGYLPNDRRHQVKMRGTYAFSDNWQVGATFNAQSGRPVNAFGVGNPFDGSNYHSNFICVANCTSENPSERVYELSPRAAGGRLPWTFDVGASVTYLRSFGNANMRIKFAAYNLLNQERVIEVDDELETDIGFRNPSYREGTGYQSPRYFQLTASIDF